MNQITKVSNPTYTNFSAPISEPNKPFSSLDHKYTPEELLQYNEGRVAFSLGLKPTTIEHNFWHARRMAFNQCSLTGTTHSWYIRLNETFENIWFAFAQLWKYIFLLKRTIAMNRSQLTFVKKGERNSTSFCTQSSTTG